MSAAMHFRFVFPCKLLTYIDFTEVTWKFIAKGLRNYSRNIFFNINKFYNLDAQSCFF